MMGGTVEDIAYQLAALASAHARRECNKPEGVRPGRQRDKTAILALSRLWRVVN